eukprot:UN30663
MVRYLDGKTEKFALVPLKRLRMIEKSDVYRIESEPVFNHIIRLNKLVVAKIGASWCSFSVTIDNHFRKLSMRNPSIVFIDVENGNVKGCPKYDKLCGRFNIRAYPTFLFFVNGSCSATVEGANITRLNGSVARFVEAYDPDCFRDARLRTVNLQNDR